MNLENASIADLIYGVGVIAFFGCLLLGATTTIARIAYYRVNRYRRPKLLVRDAVLVTGFAVSLGAVFVARALGLTGLRNNVLWAVLTTIPALVAVGYYAYVELFVIERPRPGSTMRDDPYLDPPGPHLPPRPGR